MHRRCIAIYRVSFEPFQDTSPIVSYTFQIKHYMGDNSPDVPLTDPAPVTDYKAQATGLDMQPDGFYYAQVCGTDAAGWQACRDSQMLQIIKGEGMQSLVYILLLVLGMLLLIVIVLLIVTWGIIRQYVVIGPPCTIEACVHNVGLGFFVLCFSCMDVLICIVPLLDVSCSLHIHPPSSRRRRLMEHRIVCEGLATMTGLMDHMDEETHTLKVTPACVHVHSPLFFHMRLWSRMLSLPCAATNVHQHHMHTACPHTYVVVHTRPCPRSWTSFSTTFTRWRSSSPT